MKRIFTFVSRAPARAQLGRAVRGILSRRLLFRSVTGHADLSGSAQRSLWLQRPKDRSLTSRGMGRFLIDTELAEAAAEPVRLLLNWRGDLKK